MLEDKAHDLMVSISAWLPLIVEHALNVFGAIVILVFGLWLAGRVHRLVVRVIGRAPHLDTMLKGFFGAVARYLVLTVTLLAVLSQFGIQTTSLIAVIGAAGLAIGLALQGTLSNLAAGIMLLIFRPFRVDHKVQIGGNSGAVRELSLFWTELVSDDNVQIIVPNSAVWGQPIRNFSTYRAPSYAGEVRFRVAEDVALGPALEKVGKLLAQHPHILADPTPSVLLDRNSTDNALEIVASFATAKDETAIVKSELIRAVHEAALDAGPIELPAWRSLRHR